MNAPLIGFGQVRHKRLKPVEHAFAYPTFFLLLPMRAMHALKAAGDGPSALAHNRRGIISFHDSDHGDGRANSLGWLDELLALHNIHDADGEAWLHCYPRMLGYAFKPVSFWYCHRADDSLRAIVVEVNNTHGERHCYVLDEPAWGREIAAPKAFFVSPFCKVEGSYRFRFWLTGQRENTIVRIDHDDETGPLLQTSVSGELEPVTARALRRAVWQHPILTLAITARIHWQAARLWMARVPFVRHLPQSR
ncbi:DUF1365 domain-containing protein [Caenimonas koreensis]|uniref:DUF1365 family protein n=1 Tax=Caenimonas koreensis DSM 17982 TaxID=1121255 RepID=A0A844AQ48_9BURK|nr:DUF1365 domain-containing protein [Caenimonas koreensis]MRD46350.1 DUF1365 family protein [Caenimonas koreensis DSM 17982]